MQFIVSISYHDLPNARIIVDIAKSYTLQQIGTYTSSLENQIVHSFISMDDLCMNLPSSEICMYATGSTKSALVELATMLGNRLVYTTLSDVSKDYISNLIGKNLEQTLKQQHRSLILNENRTIEHVSNDQIFSSKDDEETSLLPLSSIKVDQIGNTQSSQEIRRFSESTLAIILHQINNKILGFDFMNDQEKYNFLKNIFIDIDKSFRLSNIRESLELFHQLVVAQSIFISRHCSLDQQLSLSTPCVVVSTMFVKPQPNDQNSFSVYKFKALPVMVNGENYFYSNIPTFIGIHRDRQSLIIWEDASLMNDCLVTSLFITCRNMPLITSLANYPCLAQLFSGNIETNDSCQVLKSMANYPGILEIGNGLWFLYPMRGTHFCHVYSTANSVVESITIDKEMIVNIPCDKKAICFGNEISSSLCDNQPVMILPMSWNRTRKEIIFKIPMADKKNRLLSTYKRQLIRSYEEAVQDFTDTRSFLRNSVNEIVYIVVTIIFFFVSAIILYLFKYLKSNVQTELDNLTEIIHHTLMQ